MRNIFLFAALALLYSCDDPALESNNGETNADIIEPLDVNLNLSPGSLNANDQFTEIDLPLEVTESNDLVPLQVGATILDLNGHNPEFLRIEFSSNHVEWVGYSHNSIEIYDTEEECLALEDYCDEVIVGAGTSGYFEIEGGHIAIQNAYCRYADESYDFTVTAVVHDLEYWPVAMISDPVDIQISCQMMD